MEEVGLVMVDQQNLVREDPLVILVQKHRQAIAALMGLPVPNGREGSVAKIGGSQR